MKKPYEQNYSGRTAGPLRLTSGYSIWQSKTIKPLYLGSGFPDCQAVVRLPGYSHAEAKDFVQYMMIGLQSSAKYFVGSDRSTTHERFAQTLTGHMNLAKKPGAMAWVDLGAANGWLRFELYPTGGASATADKLATIRSAIRDKTTLRFRYPNAEDVFTTRRVLVSGLYISAAGEVFFTAEKLLRGKGLIKRSYRVAQAEELFTENLKRLTPEISASFLIANGNLTVALHSEDEPAPWASLAGEE